MAFCLREEARSAELVAARAAEPCKAVPCNPESCTPSESWNKAKFWVCSAAIHGGVADVLALHDVDDVLGDVGGVVADAFKVFCGQDELKSGKHHARIAHHVGKQFAENLIAVVVHLIVGG